MKKIFKFLLSEYWLELSALAVSFLFLVITMPGFRHLLANLCVLIVGLTGSVFGLILFALLLVVFLALYFLPTIIAGKRKHRNVLAIFVLNLIFAPVFGIGWVVALVWACLNQQAPVVIQSSVISQ